MIPRKKPVDPNPAYGDRMPADLRGPAMLGAADGSVNEMMRMLGSIPSYRPIDSNAPPPAENPLIRFFNVTADQPNARNIIRAQVYDTERGGYGANLTLDSLLDRADRDPAFAGELSKLFGPGAKDKAFQKRFGSDVNFARLFVDVLGERGALKDTNVIDPYTRQYRKGAMDVVKAGMPGTSPGEGDECLAGKDSKGVCKTGETFQLGLSLAPHVYDAKGPYQ